MNDVNWWLMALSFLLGLLLTFAFMIRRVTREVPIYSALGRGPKGAEAAAAEESGVKAPAVAATAATAATGVAAVSAPEADADTDTGAGRAEGEVEAPYGEGSARAGSGGSGPVGWLIKGNEDSMLFHTPASPSYDETIAEIWFVNEATAEAAGFTKYK